jgi:hypothetical protein
MTPGVYVGLAVSSRSTSLLATALFGDVHLTFSSTTSVNQPPFVNITSPASTSTVPVDSIVTITAAASDPDGTVARVDFYAGPLLIGSSTSAPYEVTWYGATPGLQALTAVAVDDSGAAMRSSVVNLQVGDLVSAGPGGGYQSPPPVPKVSIGMSFTPSPDHDTGVSWYQLELHGDGDLLTDKPLVITNLGKPAVLNGAIELKIDASLDLVPGGTYYIVLKAVGPGGTSAEAISSLFSK